MYCQFCLFRDKRWPVVSNLWACDVCTSYLRRLRDETDNIYWYQLRNLARRNAIERGDYAA